MNNLVNLRNIKPVRLIDYSQYNYPTSRTGGDYGYTTHYSRIGNNWEVSYETTSDLPYCPRCGTFGCNCGDDFEVISTEELENIIEKFVYAHLHDPDYDIYCQKF